MTNPMNPGLQCYIKMAPTQLSLIIMINSKLYSVFFIRENIAPKIALNQKILMDYSLIIENAKLLYLAVPIQHRSQRISRAAPPPMAR